MAQNNQAQLAYQKIREKIISRTFEPGQRLIESSCAQNFNVNRADVRQALSRLLGEGLLRAGAKGGFFVREFTHEETLQLNEVRLILETAAAKLAINRATKKDIAELTKICEHMVLMADNGYVMGVFEADLRFHEVFLRTAHNEKLENIYKSSNLPLSLSMPTITISKKALLKDAEDHSRIVEALKKKDLQRVIELISKGLTEKAAR